MSLLFLAVGFGAGFLVAVVMMPKPERNPNSTVVLCEGDYCDVVAHENCPKLGDTYKVAAVHCESIEPRLWRVSWDLEATR